MHTDTLSKKHNIKNAAKNILLVIISILLLSCVALFFAVPIYLSSSSGKNFILSKINNAIDGKVDIASLSVGWFKGLRAEKLNFVNNLGTTKISAEELSARPSYLALISGRIEIDSAIVNKPYIQLTAVRQKKQKTVTNEKPAMKTTPPVMPLNRMNLTIHQGNCKITAPDANEILQTLELKNINSTLALKPPGSKSSFNVSMIAASQNQQSSITAAGEIKTDKKNWSIANVTGELSIEVNNLDLSTLAPLLAVLDINAATSGIITTDINARLNRGQFENLAAKVNATDIDITAPFLKGDRLQSSKLIADVLLSSTQNEFNIQKLKIEADGITADVKGTIPRTLDSIEKFLNADSPDTLQASFDCDLAKTLRQIKTVAKFKQDFDINYGRLSGNVSTSAQNGTRTVAGKVKLWALEGKFPVKRIILSKPIEVDAKIISQKQAITVQKLFVDSSFVKAQLSGTADNMNYTADIDLANFRSDVGQFFEIKPQLTGSAQITGRCSLVNRIFSNTGNLTSNNVTITMPDGTILSEPSALANFDLQADLNQKKLIIKNADIAASIGKVNINNLTTALSKDVAVPLQFNTNFEVDIEKLERWATALNIVKTASHFAGFANGDLIFKKNNNIVEASTKQILVENLKISSPEGRIFTQPNMTITFAGRFDIANKIYDITRLNITSPQIKISGNLSNSDLGTNIKTEGNFKAEYDLTAASSIIAPFVPHGFSATGKRNDSLWFSSIYPKSAPAQFRANLNAKTTFGFDSAEYMGLKFGNSNFNVKIEKGIMTISPFSTSVNNGILNFAATANLSGSPPMLQTPGNIKMFDRIQITRQTSDTLLRYINPVFADATDITGTLNFECEKFAIPLEKGYQNAIAITGTLSIDNMRLGTSTLLAQIIQLTGVSANPTITVLPTRFVLANGILRYDNMQMNFNDKPVNFSGQIGLDKSMRMNVTLPWTHSGQRITLPLKGTIDKPEIDIAKLVEQQVQQEIERQIRKGLEELLKK